MKPYKSLIIIQLNALETRVVCSTPDLSSRLFYLIVVVVLSAVVVLSSDVGEHVLIIHPTPHTDHCHQRININEQEKSPIIIARLCYAICRGWDTWYPWPDVQSPRILKHSAWNCWDEGPKVLSTDEEWLQCWAGPVSGHDTESQLEFLRDHARKSAHHHHQCHQACDHHRECSHKYWEIQLILIIFNCLDMLMIVLRNKLQ